MEEAPMYEPDMAPSTSLSHEANNDPVNAHRPRKSTTPATALLPPSLEIPSLDLDQVDEEYANDGGEKSECEDENDSLDD
jgi:hypothetical protein